MPSMFAQESIPYLALGDSYTIGEQVAAHESWPFQLTSYLNSEGYNVQSPEVIAVTGWRTDELLDSIAAQNYNPNSFGLVSLLIGVNNQYQGKSLEQFEIDFERLLTTAITLSSNNEKGVFVVGIPDYSLSEFAKEKELKGVSRHLKAYNKIIERISENYGVKYYPLQKLSKSLHKDRKMLAEDMLHPSGEQYKVWVDSFKEHVAQQLNNY